MRSSDRLFDTDRLRSAASGAVTSRWPRLVFVCVLGLILSAVLYQALERFATKRIQLDFERDASDRISAFELSLRHGLDTLTALDAFFSASSDIDRRAFRAFTSEHLIEEPGVSFLGWAPRVEFETLRSFEATVRATGSDRPEIAAALESFQVFEIRADKPSSVGERSDYFPVLFAEPARIARHTIGFDVASHPVQSEALERARKARTRVVSGRDLMNPTLEESFGVMVFEPVFERTDAAESPSEATGPLLGVVMGMFDVGAVLERGLERLEPRGIDIAVHDLDAPRTESLLYFHPSRIGTPERDRWGIGSAWAEGDLGLAKTVRVADRSWLVSCRPAVGYVAARQTLAPMIGLGSGLALTALLSAGFFVSFRRETEARQNARDLLAAKTSLEQEAREREATRIDLARSEERFRQVFAGAPVGVGTADLEGRFLEANPALCRMLDTEERELLGKRISEVVHPEDREEEERQLGRLVAGEAETVRYSERLIRRDGGTVWVELNVSLVRDEGGGPLYFIGQLQDITERRETSERLRRARETQERILNTLPIHVFLKDREGRIRFINDKGLEFLGRSREDVVGKTDFDLFPEGQAQALREVDREVMANGSFVSREEVVSVRGRRVTLLAGKTPISVEGWEGPHLLGFSIDITPIKQAEEALAKSEHRFRELFERMTSGVAIYEAVDDGADFVFQDYNRAAERMDRVPREQVIGKRLTEVFPGAEDMGVLDMLRAVWRTGQPGHLPSTQYRDSRLEGWRENHAYRLPSGEVVAMYDDVSDRKRLESELLHAQKMEAIGRLAGGVAHDFNNLLQVVAGNTELLLEGSFDPNEREKMLGEIHEQSERGIQLVRRLLVFSRRESYSPKPMELGDVMRGAETLVRRLLKENIELTMDHAESPLPIRGDHGQLEQVLMNLVVNASDAMPAGGRLEIQSGAAGESEVWFSVRDSGPGIAEEVLDKVFDPYFTTKSAAQGTGLGLALVDGIVSVHGGRIEVENRPGRGVEFKVLLPRNEGAAEEEELDQPVARVERARGERVLVVEDQDLVRKTMETMLTTLGYEVETAADGSQARKRSASGQFDLLVSDIVLPDTTGVELALEMRAQRPGIAVLLVSGYAEDAVRERGADLRFLQKPFRLEDLAVQAAEALREAKRVE